ncbi:MAG: hypothetical protein Phog2KO_04560 [Phototrophicaceae bacterium]
MKKIRRFSRWQLTVLVVLLVAIVTGCANVRRGVSWPSLELVTINDQARVLISYDGQVEAIDPYQGAQIHIIRDAEGEVVRNTNGDVSEWILRGNDYDGSQFFVSPFEIDGNFLFPTYNNRILEVDLNAPAVATTNIIELTDGVIADVVVTGDLIYVPYRSQDVVALDSETYEEIWRFDTVEGVWAAPLLADGVLYIASINHKLYAVDALTGQSLWAEPVDLDGAIASTPVLHNGSLYVGSYSHFMYQISLTGEITNTYEGENWIWGSPVIQNDVLYYTDLSGYVYALNTSDLSEIWSERPAGRGIRPAPIVTDNYVVVAARDGNVFWLNIETGATVQSIEIDGKPELLSDLLYLPADEETGRPELILIASTDNKRLVTALNMQTFSQQWVYGR